MSDDFEKAKTGPRALEILGLDQNKEYTADELKSTYKKLALKYHPDINKSDDPEVKKKWLEVSYAYKMLTNPSFRYFELEEKKDLDVIFPYNILFEEGFFGKTIRFNLNFLKPTIDEGVDADKEKDLINLSTPIEPLVVKVPPGTIQKDYVFHCKGLQGRSRRGDVLIRINTQPHPLFKMEKKDILMRFEVSLEKMITGGKELIQTMYGLKKLIIPPGTQPGEKLIIKKCGVSKEGDQIVEVFPTFPRKDELKTSEFWKKMDIKWGLEFEIDDDVENLLE